MAENIQNNPEKDIEDAETPLNTDIEAGEKDNSSTSSADPAEELRIEVAEMKDKYLRLYAEFENFRRRTAKEKMELISTANAELIKAVLPVVDDFQRGISSFENATEIEPLKEGVSLIYQKLIKTLESKGLKPMDSTGQVFDAEIHESIAQFPAGDDQKGKVIEETEKGYFLNDKVIRYAKVVVGV